MKILIIGATGLLGSEAAKQFINKGHEITGISLPGIPNDSDIPQAMKLIFGNFMEMSNQVLSDLFLGQDYLVFAAGVDERVEKPAPIFDFYKTYNIDATKRILELAKLSKIKGAVVLGSYFSYLNRIKPEMKLTKYHPYIRARVIQSDVALSFADENFSVAVLELPYIFGTQKGRKPVWTILIERIIKMKRSILYPSGGSAMITVRQVGEAIVGATLKNQGGHMYPIGYYNLSWKQMIEIMKPVLKMEHQKVKTVSKWLFNIGMYFESKKAIKKNIEHGLNLKHFADLQYTHLYIDKDLASTKLGVTADDINKAIQDSTLQSIEAINHIPMIDMMEK